MEEKLIDIERIKKVRMATGLSQRAFADSIGMSPSQWSAYETGIKNPGLKVLLKIAKKYDVSMDYLCGTGDTVRNKPTMADIAKFFWELEIRYEGISYDFELQRVHSLANTAGYKPKEHEGEVFEAVLKFRRDFDNEKALVNCLVDFFEDWQDELTSDPEELKLWHNKTMSILSNFELSPKSKESLDKEMKERQTKIKRQQIKESKYNKYMRKDD